jgi:hypothetical protein
LNTPGGISPARIDLCVCLWNVEKATPVQNQPLVVLDELAALDASCSSSCDVDAFGL